MSVRDAILALPDDVLRSGHISADYLVFMDFATGPRRWWTGWGDLRANGEAWQGIGNVIGISDIPMSYQPSADQVTFTISAADADMLVLSRNSQEQVKGRDVVIYHQFFDVTNGWAPLGPAFAVYSGLMDQVRLKKGTDDEGRVSRSIELTCEGIFSNRNAPPNGRWTDSDQKRRHPGDRGCERMHLYANYSPTWTV